jgi:PleD family two-component response regulator
MNPGTERRQIAAGPNEELENRYPAMSAKHRAILIIDDNPDVPLVLKLILEAKNFTIWEAENGEIGCEVAVAKIPALILCDEQMPRLDGLQTLRRLKSTPATAAIPVLMIGGTGKLAEGGGRSMAPAGSFPSHSKWRNCWPRSRT